MGPKKGPPGGQGRGRGAPGPRAQDTAVAGPQGGRRGKDDGGKGLDPKPNASPMVEFPPTPNMTDKERKDEENAWSGTVAMVNQEKKFGFLKADNGLPREYKGDSLFFHFNVVKNSSGKPSRVGSGTKVKFVLYKAKAGDTDTLEKPKAFAVFTMKQPKQQGGQKGENPKPRAESAGIGQSVKKNLAAGSGPPMKVSIFWDIENCRPKMNTILTAVVNIRKLVLQGHQEQSFMVVCDVTSENKDAIKQLEDANVNVLHRSRTKKDSSDEVLRQQMRKVVDTSSNPGRIVLISGDSDFSTDLHSFRFTKLWEIVLLHNAGAKEALKMTANYYLPFDVVSAGKLTAKTEAKVDKDKEKRKKKKVTLPTCNAGHPLEDRHPDGSSWFCSASKEDGGCKRALAEKPVAAGKISSEKYPSHYCTRCSYRLCDLCFQKRAESNAQKKELKKEKNETKKETKKDTNAHSTNLARTGGKARLSGQPGVTPQQRDSAVEEATTVLKSGSVDKACMVLCKVGHSTTMGDILENLVICVMETDSQTRVATGHLMDRLLSQTLISQDQLEREVLNKVMETAADMTSVIPNFWDSLAEIFCLSFKNCHLPLAVLKDSAKLLPNEKMVGEFVSAILNNLALSGKMKTHKAWKESGLKWTDFVANTGNIGAFLETHNLGWLGTGQLDLQGTDQGDLLSFNSDEGNGETDQESGAALGDLLSFNSDDESSEEDDESEEEDEDEEIEAELIQF